MPTIHGSQSTTDDFNSTSNSTSKNIKIDERKQRSTVLQILPKLPSNDSLSNSPGPSSPGGTFMEKMDNTSSDKSPDPKLTRKESYKAQRKNYRREKKRVANELLNSLKDPSVVVLADWLKIRGSLKSWTKLWCVLKPGLLLLYKSPKCKKSKTKNSGAGSSGGRKEDSIRRHFVEVIIGTKNVLMWQVCKNEVSVKARRLRKHFEKCAQKHGNEKLADLESSDSDLETEDSNNPARIRFLIN